MSPTRAKLRYQLFCEFRFFGNSRHVGLPAKLSLFSRTFNFHPTLKEKRMVSFQKNGRVKHAYFEHFLLFLRHARVLKNRRELRVLSRKPFVQVYSQVFATPKTNLCCDLLHLKKGRASLFFRGMKLPLWRKVAERVAFLANPGKKTKLRKRCTERLYDCRKFYSTPRSKKKSLTECATRTRMYFASFLLHSIATSSFFSSVVSRWG